MTVSEQIRTYDRRESIVFLKTHDAFGGLSNMAAGYRLRVNGLHILTSEALYQACRFPHRPEVQRLIIAQTSPMTAKMKSKPYRHDSRPDWDRVRVKVMRWSLRVKLAQNWEKFSKLLLATGDKPIVEESRKDDFWGAKPTSEHRLVGINVLGRLLMELREALKAGNAAQLQRVEPLRIPEFLLDGSPIQAIIPSKPKPFMPNRTLMYADYHFSAMPNFQFQPSLLEHHMTHHSPQEMLEEAQASASTNLQPYPAYKDSGVSWLGKIPAHWEVMRQRNVARMFVSSVDKHTIEGEEFVRLCNYVDVYKNDRITQSLNFMQASASKSEIERFRLRTGDVLITKDSESWNDIGVPALVEYEAPDLVSGYHLAILRPYELIKGAYLFRTIQSRGVATQYHVAANGVTRYGLTHDAIKNVLIPVPPLAEQDAIVRYLDHVDRRIRRYINDKRRLVTLLNEQKQAIINKVVMQGLNPNVRLKPSGIEWLGNVPEHWEISRSKWLFSVRKELASPDDVQLSATQAYGVIPQEEFEQRVGRRVVKILMHLDKRKHVEKDDFVMSMRSFQGGLERAWAKGAIRSSYVILKPGPNVDISFFSYLFKSYSYIRALQATANFIRDGQDLTEANLREVALPLIPLPEQKAIADYIGTVTANINDEVVKLGREIDLIREYRTRLITDVVTGKIDVRAAAANLPNEGDMPALDALIEDDEVSDEADMEAIEVGDEM